MSDRSYWSVVIYLLSSVRDINNIRKNTKNKEMSITSKQSVQLQKKSVFFIITFVNDSWEHSNNLRSGEVYSIQHDVIKFVSDLRQVDGFVRYSWNSHNPSNSLNCPIKECIVDKWHVFGGMYPQYIICHLISK